MTSADHGIVRIVRNGAHNEVYINGTRLHRMSNFTLEQCAQAFNPKRFDSLVYGEKPLIRAVIELIGCEVEYESAPAPAPAPEPTPVVAAPLTDETVVSSVSDGPLDVESLPSLFA